MKPLHSLFLLAAALLLGGGSAAAQLIRVPVVVDTSGVVTGPTNFWTANSASIVAAAGTGFQAGSGNLTNWSQLSTGVLSGFMLVVDFQTFSNLLGSAAFTASSAYQPADADLTTFAGITPAANTISLLSAANYSAMRTLLSLVPGTDVQAWSANGDAWAALSTASKVSSLSGNATNLSTRGGITFSTNSVTWAATTYVDVGTNAYQFIGTLGGHTTFHTTNRVSAIHPTVVRMKGAATNCNLTFNSSWVWVGTKPTSLSANKTAVLSLTAYGTQEGDILAAYAAEQ